MQRVRLIKATFESTSVEILQQKCDSCIKAKSKVDCAALINKSNAHAIEKNGSKCIFLHFHFFSLEMSILIKHIYIYKYIYYYKKMLIKAALFQTSFNKRQNKIVKK